jgi:hypothetical protein
MKFTATRGNTHAACREAEYTTRADSTELTSRDRSERNSASRYTNQTAIVA